MEVEQLTKEHAQNKTNDGKTAQNETIETTNVRETNEIIELNNINGDENDSEEEAVGDENIETGILNWRAQEYWDFYMNCNRYQTYSELYTSEIVSAAIRCLCVILSITVNQWPPIVVLAVHFLVYIIFYLVKLYRNEALKRILKIKSAFEFSFRKSLYELFLPARSKLKRISWTNAILLCEDVVFIAYWAIEDLHPHVTNFRIVVSCTLIILDIIFRIILNTDKENTVVTD